MGYIIVLGPGDIETKEMQLSTLEMLTVWATFRRSKRAFTVFRLTGDLSLLLDLCF